MDQAYEYQVSWNRGGFIGGNSEVTRDSNEAGRIYRKQRELLVSANGGTVELKRRPVTQWETVESIKV